MGQAGYQKQSSNLNRRLRDAEIAIEGAWRAAFMQVYDDHLPSAKKALKKTSKEALEETEEFNHELFTTPFFTILDIDELYVIIPEERTKTVSVFINMKEFAGNLNDYFEAVALAREQGGFGKGTDPDKASIFWRENIYRPAREGSVGRPSKKESQQRQQYWSTILLRRENMSTLAPWWELMEYGNNLRGRGEGQPYPSYGPQLFVAEAERTIEDLFDQALEFTYEDYLERVAVEGISSREVIERIEAVVTEVTDNPGEYKAGDILAEIVDRGRQYLLYISRTGQLGYILSKYRGSI